MTLQTTTELWFQSAWRNKSHKVTGPDIKPLSSPRATHSQNSCSWLFGKHLIAGGRCQYWCSRTISVDTDVQKCGVHSERSESMSKKGSRLSAGAKEFNDFSAFLTKKMEFSGKYNKFKDEILHLLVTLFSTSMIVCRVIFGEFFVADVLGYFREYICEMRWCADLRILERSVFEKFAGVWLVFCSIRLCSIEQIASVLHKNPPSCWINHPSR